VSGAADAVTAPAAPTDRVPGYDRIGTAALVHTAQVVAAETLGSPLRDVRARVADDGRGSLAVTVTAPLVMPVLGARTTSATTPTTAPESVIARTHRARAAVAERISAITGRQVQRVDVTFTSSVVDTPRRVR
jgi:hypothetical protein